MTYDITFQSKVLLLVIDTIESVLGTSIDRVFFKVPPPLPTFPLVVYQFQDGGGSNADTMNANGWVGLVTIKALDTTIVSIASILAECSNLLDNVDIPDYDISFHLLNPIDLPVDRLNNVNIYSMGLIYRVNISPK